MISWIAIKERGPWKYHWWLHEIVLKTGDTLSLRVHTLPTMMWILQQNQGEKYLTSFLQETSTFTNHVNCLQAMSIFFCLLALQLISIIFWSVLVLFLHFLSFLFVFFGKTSHSSFILLLIYFNKFFVSVNCSLLDKYFSVGKD